MTVGNQWERESIGTTQSDLVDRVNPKRNRSESLACTDLSYLEIVIRGISDDGEIKRGCKVCRCTPFRGTNTWTRLVETLRGEDDPEERDGEG